MRTGELVDYEVLSQVCQECIRYGKLDKESFKYKTWATNHTDACSINHEGSSGNMEWKGVVMAFRRSIDKRDLMHPTFVGEGNSSCFGNVLEAIKKEFGGSYPLEKEECVKHIQKRMEAALNEREKVKKIRKK